MFNAFMPPEKESKRHTQVSSQYGCLFVFQPCPFCNSCESCRNKLIKLLHIAFDSVRALPIILHGQSKIITDSIRRQFLAEPETRCRFPYILAEGFGAAGYISMEDGCVGGFVQRALRFNDGDSGVVMMGGYDAQSQPFRSSEAAIRGFWKEYRALTGS